MRVVWPVFPVLTTSKRLRPRAASSMISIADIDTITDGGDVSALEADSRRRTKEDVRAYLIRNDYEFEEFAKGNETVFVLSRCPYKKRECGDRTWIIIREDGSIVAGCHADKCAGKNWADMQAAIGEPLYKTEKP